MIPIIILIKTEKDKRKHLQTLPEKTTLQIYPDQGVLKINQIREVKKQIPLLRSQKIRIIINNFDLANTQAQNAALKLLEEESAFAEFILTAYNINNILPTIQSRCRVLDMRDNRVEHTKDMLKTNKLDFDKAVAQEKQQALEFIDKLINLLFYNLRRDKTRSLAAVIHKALESRYLLEKNNLNPQLTIDHLLIMMKKSNIILKDESQ